MCELFFGTGVTITGSNIKLRKLCKTPTPEFRTRAHCVSIDLTPEKRIS